MKGKSKRASGGKVYAGAGSKTMQAAEERACGGRAKRKAGGKVAGDAAKDRLDRSCRKSGGRVGAERSPMSGAARLTGRPGGREDGLRDD